MISKITPLLHVEHRSRRNPRKKWTICTFYGQKLEFATDRLLDRNNHLQSCSLCKLLLAMIEGHESFLFQFQSARYVQNV
jgi:hypothetical protein